MKIGLARAITNSIEGGDALLDQFMATRDIEIPDPLKAIEELAKKQQYSDKFIELTKESWHIEPDETMYSVINAFTRSAQSLADDKRIQVETFAGSLMKGVAA